MILSLKRLFKSNKPHINLIVLNSFRLKFPLAKDIVWQQIDFSKWHVNFTLKTKKCSALFNSQGKWLETVTLIPFNETPKKLQLTLEEKDYFDGLQIINHVQNSNRSFYEVELNNGLYKYKLLSNFSGKIIGKVLL